MENNLNNEIQLSGIPNNIPVEINKVKYNSAYVYKIIIGKNGEQPFESGKLHIAVSVSGSEAQGRWFPTTRQYDRAVHQTWNSENQTSYMNGAPIYSYYRQDDSNILTVAADDSFITWQICSGVDEPSQQISFDISSEFINCDVVNVNLLVDRSDCPYYQAIQNAARWWAENRGSNQYIPECAYEPVYSTWYAFQRSVDAESILSQCRTAVEYGCRTLIIDDGWAAPIDTCYYEDSGDWKPNREKFPDIRSFVDEIHKLGMKAILWIAPGLSGFNSRSNELYRGKFISSNDWLRMSILDIRYPEIRSRLCGDVCRIVENYKFDGVKIDFIDSIHAPDCEPDQDRDCTSVSNALRDMLGCIHSNLMKCNPEVMIEYRQNYCGPDVITNANIVRGSDCAQDYLSNRLNTIDLRLYTNAAVHSDMVQFIYNDTPESTALQLTNILFSTPQISPRFEYLSDDQKKVLKFWLDFMSRKRELLQKSSFEPSRCYMNYPSVTVRNQNERLTALYGEQLLILDKITPNIYIVNAYTRAPIYVGSSNTYETEYQLLNCMGEETGRGTIRLEPSPKAVNIPFNGMMILRSQ